MAFDDWSRGVERVEACCSGRLAEAGLVAEAGLD